MEEKIYDSNCKCDNSSLSLTFKDKFLQDWLKDVEINIYPKNELSSLLRPFLQNECTQTETETETDTIENCRKAPETGVDSNGVDLYENIILNTSNEKTLIKENEYSLIKKSERNIVCSTPKREYEDYIIRGFITNISSIRSEIDDANNEDDDEVFYNLNLATLPEIDLTDPNKSIDSTIAFNQDLEKNIYENRLSPRKCKFDPLKSLIFTKSKKNLERYEKEFRSDDPNIIIIKKPLNQKGLKRLDHMKDFLKRAYAKNQNTKSVKNN